MEKPDEEGLVVAVAGAWPNKLTGRCPDEDDCVGGKVKIRKGAGHGAGLLHREVPRRVDEPAAWA
jgi:hypothetical protein